MEYIIVVKGDIFVSICSYVPLKRIMQDNLIKTESRKIWKIWWGYRRKKTRWSAIWNINKSNENCIRKHNK